jgi:hypothetical protein
MIALACIWQPWANLLANAGTKKRVVYTEQKVVATITLLTYLVLAYMVGLRTQSWGLSIFGELGLLVVSGD